MRIQTTMKKMNIICLAVLIMALVFTLCGCGKSDQSAVNQKNEKEESTENEKENQKDADLTENTEKPQIGVENKNTNDGKDADEIEEPVKEEIVPNPSQKYSHLSTWAAYWDNADVVSEMSALGSEVDTVVCFEALYGSDAKTILHPEGCNELLSLLKQNYGDKTIYLSYTNDFQNADGSYTQKSVDLLKIIFSNPENIDSYSSDMIKDAKAAGVDGIELDYENMRKDETLFAGYAEFVNALYKKCIDESLSLRVTTEYQTAAKCRLINGPEYVIMCYNLYGYGTEPGPKANIAFLSECADNFAYLDNVKFAFSLGGFKWNNGNVSAVTENEALALLAAFGAVLEHESSGGAYFSYAEADGSISTVYYADATTINTWKAYLAQRGYTDFALWRLGGNNLNSLGEMK